MSTTQRKRHSGTSSNSRRTSKRRRHRYTSSRMENETVQVLDNSMLDSAEVVDLTRDASEPVVVDLTNNDSMTLFSLGPRSRRSGGSESYVVSSDEEETAAEEVYMADRPRLEFPPPTYSSTSRATPGNIICPICMDSHTEIIQSGRLLVSTKCGHLFCSQCLRDAIKQAHTCPTCRMKLNHKQYHPIYI
ncbi:RING finger protein 4 isoform X1 [Erpetoichthys calabaricus]|uniref:RING finger protein 4 isoform X1 n=2 Tax=Erpetoichthys calabaricus TaxID=27687 RepID=UPI0022345AB4|nr:RING finger protein 4 isoform X1 [Erpetoichthys calabaricus]